MSSVPTPGGYKGPISQEDVAIIGMACIFPGAPDLRTYWQNIIAKVDAVGDPPEDWEAELFYDPSSTENDRVYCKRGGYLGDLARFDPLKFGIMPNSVDGGEPDQFLALQVAQEALADSGYANAVVDRERVEVIIGRGTYINRGFTTVVQHGLVVDQVLRILKELHPEHSTEELQQIKRELKASLPPFNAEMAPALVPNIMSGRIANRLDFMGPNYTVDAACASSLIAVDRGLQDLLSMKCDLALVGGVHASTPAPILMIFCQLNALSRRGQIRPFDKNADGTLLGEGLGFVVLKRRREAERDGDRIYALIKGVGTASDGRALGLLAPRMEGEELALRRAYEATGISPATVGLIEAHGTGTPVGDAAEIEALRRVFGHRNGEPPSCAIGSVKSMISHLIPAAGIAGIIKSALALHHRVLPPTLHCDQPNPKLELQKTSLYINTETRPWIHGASTPRRAGVNAFGFGGINAHVILEEHKPVREDALVSYQQQWDSEVCVVQGDCREDLLQQCEHIKTYLASSHQPELKDLAFTLNSSLRDSSMRLAIVASSLSEFEQKLGQAMSRLADSKCQQIKDAQGTYFFQRPLSQQGKLAFLFPGEGSQYFNMLSDLCVHFPEVRAWFDLIDRAFLMHKRKYLPSQVVFPPPLANGQPEESEEMLWRMDCGPEAIFTANQAIFTLLSRLHIRPHTVVGHSTGEYSALVASRSNPVETEDRLIEEILELNGYYERLLDSGRIPEGVLVTVGGTDRDTVFSVVGHNRDLHLAMDNCPHQLVFCGSQEAVAESVEQLRKKGAICTQLPFRRAYHTPMFQPFCDQLREFFQRLTINPPEIEMYSCMTARPYPPDEGEIRRLAVEQWARPVRFRETIQAMYEGGTRIFVEVGPRNNLTAFVDDILRGRQYLAVPTNVPHRSGITQLNHLVGLLAAHGVPMQLDYLYARRQPQRLSFECDKDQGPKSRELSGSLRLAMGLQPLRLKREGANIGTSNHSSTLRDNQATVANMDGVAPKKPSLVAALAENHFRGAAAHCPEEIPSVDSSMVRESHSESKLLSLDSPSSHGNGSRSLIMQEYFRTMEKFLSVQQEVMQAFADRGNTSSLPSRKGQTTLIDDPPGDDGATAPEPGWKPKQEERLELAYTPGLTHPESHVAIQSGPVKLGNVAATHEDIPQVSEAIRETLLKLISEKTGYPAEMLDLGLNLEADLGIDSIKRVEILGTFQRQTGLIPADGMDRASSLKTLQQIVDYLSGQNGREADSSRTSQAIPLSGTSPTSSVESISSFPLLGTIVSLTPGRELVARRVLDLENDVFLKDHTLGRDISVTDENLRGLSVVPLTISMEMLAEAAAVLVPNKLVIGMKDIRAYRWIGLDEGQLTLQVSARYKVSAPEVVVQVKEWVDSALAVQPATPVIEGTVVFGDDYSAQSPAGDFVLRSERLSKWSPERLYADVMFHGPSFQGVVSVDRWGEDGVEGTVKGISLGHFFRARFDPNFLTDAVPLDAAGQLVAYWTAEHFETGFHIFPFRVETLKIFGPRLRPGELAKCRARIALLEGWQMRSDIEIIGSDGRVLIQVEGWWDRRFDLPEDFYRLRVSPRDVLLGRPFSPVIARFDHAESFTCCLIDHLPLDFLEAHGRIWQRVLAHLVLSPGEQKIWQSLKAPERRRAEWLLGRAAAKDAVRLFLRKRHGLRLCPADIEIVPDDLGRPLVRGAWQAELKRAPLVSIAHSHGTALAIAGDDGLCSGVGVDLEYMGHTREGFEAIAFAPAEQSLLTSVDESSREEWSLRLWCAKEAVAKAIGQGLIGGPQSLVLKHFEPETGRLEFSPTGSWVKSLPDLARTVISAFTVREGNLIAASTIYPLQGGLPPMNSTDL